MSNDSSGCADVRRPLTSGDTDGPRKADSAPPAGAFSVIVEPEWRGR